jgi:hypothetical protein
MSRFLKKLQRRQAVIANASFILRMCRKYAVKASFMKPEIYEGDAYEVETSNGTEIVPADLVGHIGLKAGESIDDDDPRFADAVESMHDYLEGSNATEITMKHGWLGRYQAPGYMDATEWSIYDSKEEAEKELQEMYGDEEEENRKVFTATVDLDERGIFRCHVSDPAGKTVWSAGSDDEDDDGNETGFWPVEDGFMKHNRDLDGLEKYLKQMKIMPEDATLEKDGF